MRKITQKKAYIIKLKDGVWLADDDQEGKETVNKRFALVFFDKEIAEYECKDIVCVSHEYKNAEIQEIK